jgi:diaminopimelate decarboxylase
MISGLMAASSLKQLSPVFPLGSGLTESGHIEVGGCDLVEVAREFGTPAYVVAPDDLRARARAFVEAFAACTDDAEIVFASKAFPCTAVLRVFCEEGLGCDVASAGELELALRAGFPGDRIHMHGNAKSIAELAAARAAGVRHIVIDNLDEIDRLEGVVAADGRGPQPVSIRVTPGVRGDTHDKISTGQADSKFGLAGADIHEAIARLRASALLHLEGIHMHIGSQILDLAPFRAAVEAVSDLPRFAEVNLGGGLGVTYTAGDAAAPSLADYAQTKVDAARAAFGAGVRIVDEPGRALVAHSTVTLYTVQSVKTNVSRYVAVDGGMSDNLRPMLYGARYEAHVADRFGADATPCKLVGKHCESSDVIVADAQLPDPRPGDIVVTPATGGYGYAMANNYNGVPRPPVVFVAGGEARLVVRRETVAELTARDV